MTIGGRLKKAWSIVAGTYQNPDQWMWEAFGAQRTLSGVSISEKSSLNLGPVYACVSKIAKTVGSLPLPVYERTADGKRKAEFHPVYELLHDRPNHEMSAMVFRETLQAHVLQWGNAYAEIQRGGTGRITGLWPMSPDQVTPFRDDAKRLWYRVNTTSGYINLRPEDVLHVPGLGFDGVSGYSVVRMAREAMGLTLAAEQFGSAFFGNGASMGGFLEHPGLPTQDQIDQLRAKLAEQHGGVENAHRLGILTGGMKYTPRSIPPDDAQFLETRKFQVVEIARWFDVPPHKIASMESATFSNIEHQSIEWAVDTIRPWCVRWEQEINRKLFTPTERTKYFSKHVIDGLLRGDYKSRMEGYSIGRNGGWMSANDIRELEDMNSIDGGDIYLVPVNMQTVDKAIAGPVEEQTTVNATIDKMARKEAKAIADNWLRFKGSNSDFWAWFDKFMARHVADISFLGDASGYTMQVRARILSGIDGVSIDEYADEAAARMHALRKKHER